MTRCWGGIQTSLVEWLIFDFRLEKSGRLTLSCTTSEFRAKTFLITLLSVTLFFFLFAKSLAQDTCNKWIAELIIENYARDVKHTAYSSYLNYVKLHRISLGYGMQTSSQIRQRQDSCDIIQHLVRKGNITLKSSWNFQNECILTLQ